MNEELMEIVAEAMASCKKADEIQEKIKALVKLKPEELRKILELISLPSKGEE